MNLDFREYVMHLHLPEPGYNESGRAQANFHLAFKVSLYFVLLLWIVTLLDSVLGLEPVSYTHLTLPTILLV